MINSTLQWQACHAALVCDSQWNERELRQKTKEHLVNNVRIMPMFIIYLYITCHLFVLKRYLQLRAHYVTIQKDICIYIYVLLYCNVSNKTYI